MSHHPRRIFTPGESRKRKEMEAYYQFKQSAPAQAQASAHTAINSKAVSTEPVCPNRLLAGYMAYEFLAKGTLLGQKVDPARDEAATLALAGSTKPEGKHEPSVSVKEEHKSYAEVASILKTDGPHIPGIVNPGQLAKWIQM